MERPTRPNRVPDLCLDDVVFWWEERLIGDYYQVCHVDMDSMSHYSHYFNRWENLVLSRKDKDLIRASRAEWLLEKEIRR
jgi:hypothetical protein